MPHLWHLLLLELHDDAAEGLATGGNVEVNLGSHCDGCVGGCEVDEEMMKLFGGWNKKEMGSDGEKRKPCPALRR